MEFGKANKQDIMKKWSDRVKVNKTALSFYWEQLMEVMYEELKQGNEVYLAGIGRFHFKKRPPMKSNLTGQFIPKHKKIDFLFNTDLARYVRVMSRD
jgi:nucleoid DNA-binding protein